MDRREKPLILLVDDHSQNLQTLNYILADAYRTVAVESGRQALAAARQTVPDLILLDVLMPEMNGYEVCGEFKADPAIREIPIIFLSAKTQPDDVMKGFACGAVDYISKPFNKTELLARVKIHLDLKTTINALELSRLHLETVFHSIPEGIVTVDRDMRVIQHNPPFVKICPFAARIKPGQNIADALQPCQGEYLKILRYTLKTQQPVKEYHITCAFEDAPKKHLILNTSPFIEKGRRVAGAILVIRDTTLLNELAEQLRDRSAYLNLIGKNPKMQQVYALIKQLADLDATVLVTGESGTGKELVAEALHYSGFRAAKPLVRVNCAVLPENILESELFGHVRGAFTGAVKDRIGRIQAAHGGTLFLDEIGDLSPYIQLKLLRFLERKEYERVGSSQTIKADVRIITATHVDLLERVRQGTLREDFYYRLKVMHIHLPPLRERLEDLSLLTEHFCQLFNTQYHKQIRGISDETLVLLQRHTWPGNVRELRHALEHAAILSAGNLISPADLPAELQHAVTVAAPVRSLAAAEVVEALRRTAGNKAKAARLLGIHRSTLYRKLLELGI